MSYGNRCASTNIRPSRAAKVPSAPREPDHTGEMLRPSLIARALLLAALTLTPLIAVTTGAGARSGFVAADAVITLEEVNAVDHPEAVFAVDSAATQAAQQIAVEHWGSNPCGAKVTLTWGVLDDDV